MFLKKFRLPFKKISHRITFSVLIFFIPSYVVIFATFNFLATKQLENRDRDQIDDQIQIYRDLFEKEGLEGLKKIVKNPRLHHQSMRFLIQVADSNNQSLFLHLPEEDNKIEAPYIENTILKLRPAQAEKWFYIPSIEGDEDAIEAKSIELSPGFKLLVGSSTDLRDDLLDEFRDIFIGILTPLILISIFCTAFISQRILSPLVHLSSSIKKIKQGELSTRAPLPAVQDELYDLTTTFNEMVQQIANLVQAMKETTDNIAHDLRTPLTRNRISAEIGLQKNSFQDLKMAAEENIENTDSMLKLLNTIIEVSKLSSNTLRLNKETFDSQKLFNEVIDLYAFVAEEKNIRIEKNIDDIPIFADRSLMKQAIANLIDNSVKYSKSDSLIKIRCKLSPQEIQIVVSDQGIGIAEDDLPRIWERLYRADRSRHEPGLGLGLSMVKIFVESHNGKVSVQSRIGEGTKILVHLPIRQI